MVPIERQIYSAGGEPVALDGAATTDVLGWETLALLENASRAYGFKQISVTDINKVEAPDPREQLAFTNLPGDFFHRLFAAYDKNPCPLMIRSRFSSAPYGWDVSELVESLETVVGAGHESVKELAALFDDYEIVGGYCVPVRGAFNRAYLATYCGSHKCSGISYPELTHSTIETIDSYFVKSRPIDIAATKLTDREIECLLWVSKGKTSGELAEIIGLSEHTVNHYLLSATRKLDSVNRTQAVAKALEIGVI